MLDGTEERQVARNEHVVGQHGAEGRRAAPSVLDWPARHSQGQQCDSEESADGGAETRPRSPQEQVYYNSRGDDERHAGYEFQRGRSG